MRFACEHVAGHGRRCNGMLGVQEEEEAVVVVVGMARQDAATQLWRVGVGVCA